MADEFTWLLLTYKVPREPSAARVYTWRKLKKLGALAVQDAIWVLPCTPRTTEQFRWLCDEIVQMGGQANLWEARSLADGQDRAWVRQFELQVTRSYQQILDGLRRRKPDLSALSRRYQQTLGQDYFRCDIGNRVRAMLLSARGGADEGAARK